MDLYIACFDQICQNILFILKHQNLQFTELNYFDDPFVREDDHSESEQNSLDREGISFFDDYSSRVRSLKSIGLRILYKVIYANWLNQN